MVNNSLPIEKLRKHVVPFIFRERPKNECFRGVAKNAHLFFLARLYLRSQTLLFGVCKSNIMEFSIQNEINSFHLFCNTIRLL